MGMDYGPSSIITLDFSTEKQHPIKPKIGTNPFATEGTIIIAVYQISIQELPSLFSTFDINTALPRMGNDLLLPTCIVVLLEHSSTQGFRSFNGNLRQEKEGPTVVLHRFPR